MENDARRFSQGRLDASRLSGFLQAVCDGSVFEPPLADEGFAPGFDLFGGLISYGPDSIDPYRRAAGYVDRIPEWIVSQVSVQLSLVPIGALAGGRAPSLSARIESLATATAIDQETRAAFRRCCSH
jgi:hypothetical protein